MFGRKKELRLTDHDHKRRLFLRRHWLRKVLIRSLWDTLTVAFIFKQRASLAADSLYSSMGVSSLSRSRCLLTGRSRSVSLSFRVSRFAFRTVANLGFVDGVSRASW